MLQPLRPSTETQSQLGALVGYHPACPSAAWLAAFFRRTGSDGFDTTQPDLSAPGSHHAVPDSSSSAHPWEDADGGSSAVDRGAGDPSRQLAPARRQLASSPEPSVSVGDAKRICVFGACAPPTFASLLEAAARPITAPVAPDHESCNTTYIPNKLLCDYGIRGDWTESEHGRVLNEAFPFRGAQFINVVSDEAMIPSILRRYNVTPAVTAQGALPTHVDWARSWRGHPGEYSWQLLQYKPGPSRRVRHYTSLPGCVHGLAH